MIDYFINFIVLTFLKMTTIAILLIMVGIIVLYVAAPFIGMAYACDFVLEKFKGYTRRESMLLIVIGWLIASTTMMCITYIGAALFFACGFCHFGDAGNCSLASAVINNVTCTFMYESMSTLSTVWDIAALNTILSSVASCVVLYLREKEKETKETFHKPAEGKKVK